MGNARILADIYRIYRWLIRSPEIAAPRRRNLAYATKRSLVRYRTVPRLFGVY
jgi:hypothetical protein